MSYESLIKIYYKYPTEHHKIYLGRFNATMMTRHFDFQIREFNHKNSYPAFFCYTEEFAALTEEIYKKHEDLLQMLNGVSPLVLEQYVLGSAVDEIRATSDIEGVYSTRREVKDVMNGTTQSARFSSIVGKYKVFFEDFAQINFSTCEDIRNFYDAFIHGEVISDKPNYKLDGVLFRKDSADVTAPSGKTIHRGVNPETKLIGMLNVALEVLNNSEIPLLVRVAVFHYFFAYVHPFYDGNGRTARFISSYFLTTRFHKLIGLRLSVVIKKNRKRYYELFEETNSEWNCGDLTPFVVGFTKIVSETFDDIVASLNVKIMQLAKYRQKLSALIESDELTKKIYEMLLYSSVYFGRGISMEGLMKETGKSRNTIKSRIGSMPENHVVCLNIGGKKFYKLNMEIFRKQG